jgi:hypothetical protein
MICSRPSRCAALLLAYFLALPSLALAPPPDSHQPTADEVIGRHIEAIGGQAAIDSIETMRYERVYVHIEDESVIHRIIHKKRPGKSRNCSVDTGSCFIVDGTRSWTKTVDPDGGTVEWSEDEYHGSQSNNFEVRFGPFIGYLEKGISVEFVATKTIDGARLHHLTMQMPGTEMWDIYFDVETGLWARYITPAGGTVTIHDYRPAGGILFPRLTEVKGVRRDGTPGHHLNATISLEMNVPVDDSMFRPDTH